MQLRRFTADTTPAALGAVRMAFGDDAIILANRRMGNQVEIIATGNAEDASSLESFMANEATSDRGNLDSHSSESPGSATADLLVSNQQVTASSSSARHSTASTIRELSAEIDSVSINEPKLSLQPPVELKPDVIELSSRIDPDRLVPPVPEVLKTDESAGLSSDPPAVADVESSSATEADVPSTLEPSSTADMQKQRGSVASAESSAGMGMHLAVDFAALEREARKSSQMLTQVLDAIDAQKQVIDKRFRSLEVNMWGAHSPNRSLHLKRLFALGIGAELAIRLVERVDADIAVEDAVRQSLALLKSTLPIAVDKSMSEDGVTVFSGPPGSGKTTAMMKLATQYVKQSGNQSIVIIGADTRRIGAFEELQAYGKLLGVPTVMAHDTQELEGLITAFAHKRMTLVDHGLADEERGMELPESLLERTDGSLRHLFVLPATLQAVNADSLMSRYCQSRDMKCVLTHLDSNSRLGELFNSIVRHNVAVAYWSDSQSVQAPLERADASVLVATAVAMSRRIPLTADDDWLQRLIQPAHQLMREPLISDMDSWSMQS